MNIEENIRNNVVVGNENTGLFNMPKEMINVKIDNNSNCV